jgi:5-amino-6-(5-phospho-D-ribitylamino)uracil phosphatase
MIRHISPARLECETGKGAVSLKVVYISDLDGTLLNQDAECPAYTVATLNELIGRGLWFGAATARTAVSAIKILSGIHINVPLILMNGVCIYDLREARYLQIEAVPALARKQMLDVIGECRLPGFVYTMQGDCLSTYYENADSPYARAFIDERVRKYGKVFTKVENFAQLGQENLIYYSVSNTKDKLIDTWRGLSSIAGLRVEFYHDIYGDNNWYLEACSRRASKQNAIQLLRDTCGFDRVVGFGDNLNDLPLFAACDESYAVGNAKPEVKGKARAVIGSNLEEGVARWLASHAVFSPR